MWVQDEVMPRAMRALTRALRVRNPVQGALKLPRRCTSTWNGSDGKCAQTGPQCNGWLPEAVPESLYGAFECAPAACALKQAQQQSFVTRLYRNQFGRARIGRPSHVAAHASESDAAHMSRPMVAPSLL
jgi:hypothetical protein